MFETILFWTIAQGINLAVSIQPPPKVPVIQARREKIVMLRGGSKSWPSSTTTEKFYLAQIPDTQP
jgi:hypothetical protein